MIDNNKNRRSICIGTRTTTRSALDARVIYSYISLPRTINFSSYYYYYFSHSTGFFSLNFIKRTLVFESKVIILCLRKHNIIFVDAQYNNLCARSITTTITHRRMYETQHDLTKFYHSLSLFLARKKNKKKHTTFGELKNCFRF